MHIYKITNKLNGEFYVGKTTKELNHRMRNHRATMNHGSKLHIHNAMRLYGAENFEIELIESVSDHSTLNEREIFWIEKLKPHYNTHKGGQGGSLPGRPDIKGDSRENWKNAFDRTGKTPWNKGKTNVGGHKWSKPMSTEQREKISKFQKQNKATCVYCGLVSNPGNIGRYHNEKCKHKKVTNNPL